MNRQDNIINICVDEHMSGKISGKMYHCYDNKPWDFSSIIQLLELMELFFNKLSFPQASTKTRTFKKEKEPAIVALEKVITAQEVMQQRGKEGSFLIGMRYRQNSSWQGDIRWIEQDVEREFISELDLLKVINNALESDKNQ